MSRDGSGPPRKITCDVPVQSLFRVQSNWDAWMKSGASGVSIPIHSLSSPARIAFIVLPMYTCTRSNVIRGETAKMKSVEDFRIFVYSFIEENYTLRLREREENYLSDQWSTRPIRSFLKKKSAIYIFSFLFFSFSFLFRLIYARNTFSAFIE